MAFQCRILADSINSKKSRLTTFEITFPRIVLAEFNTHRMFSRNAASSRAIPVNKMIENIMTDPFIPIHWGKNEKGMQASQELTQREKNVAIKIWLKQRDSAVDAVRRLAIPDYKVNRLGYTKKDKHVTEYELDVHKQIANRLLEPWMWVTDIVSATEFGNYFNLRDSEMAEPHIAKITRMMRDEYYTTTPKKLKAGEWHIPLIFDEDWTLLAEGKLSFEDLIKLSVARCARVSYLTHDGRRDLEADYTLYWRLYNAGHMSPFEHVAQATNSKKFSGNFRGYIQLRKTLINENRELYIPPTF